MPRQISDYEFSANPNAGKWASRYDWPLLTNGDKHALDRGVDYDCKLSSLIALLRKQAKDREMKVLINVVNRSMDGEFVAIQYVRDPGRVIG